MTAPKKTSYVVYYKDQTFQTMDLTKADFTKIAKAMESGDRVAVTSIGLFATDDIRSFLERIDPPAPPQEGKPIINPDDGYGDMSLADQAYLVEEYQRQEAERKKYEAEVAYQ